jgi:hypothetical protein
MMDIEPNYEKAFEHDNRRKIIKAIAEAGGVAGFSKIMQTTGVKDNNLVFHLSFLIRYGIIEQIAEGPYALRYKTPLYFIFGKNQEKEEKISYSYIGLLGEREERTEPETTVALKLLKKDGLEANLVYIVTSTAGANSWKENKLEAQWILCDGDAITDIDKIRRKVSLLVRDLIREHLVIMDCTSFNKPATIALYELAQKYLVPLIYVYEPKQRLKWLISKEQLVRRFTA